MPHCFRKSGIIGWLTRDSNPHRRTAKYITTFALATSRDTGAVISTMTPRPWTTTSRNCACRRAKAWTGKTTATARYAPAHWAGTIPLLQPRPLSDGLTVGLGAVIGVLSQWASQVFGKRSE